RLRIGYVGSLIVSKAPHVLLEAFSRLPRESASLVVAGEYADYHGDSRYRPVLDRATAGSAARFVGGIGREEVLRLLREIEVLVVPSVGEENSPFSIKEAFALGIPVVASRIGGMPELVLDGVNGLLFAPGDARALHAALSRLLDEPGLLDRLRAGIAPVRSIG